MPCARVAPGTTIPRLVFTRFHELMHGAARVADARSRLPIAPAGALRAARQPRPARAQRTAVRP
ncbi:hypothetical protein HT746_33460 [Burkholderia pyrrocinia]|uniref:hypothetical protein n=1 Tax=Burkholderia pyrrocinia TaxID=60550 RepID=UPI00157778E3|nr:hypothetical protein [Burkholderia pyrrocinia]NTX31965.1 hypothetical protein [Burkholderia pyrrocinia]